MDYKPYKKPKNQTICTCDAKRKHRQDKGCQLNWIPAIGKRPSGRFKKRWRDKIKVDMDQLSMTTGKNETKIIHPR